MRLFRIIFALSISLTFFLSCKSTQQESDSILVETESLPEKGLNILFIGNSLTMSNDLPGILERMLILADINMGVVASESRGGFGLPDHWSRPATRTRLAIEGWDIVILQQGPSATEGRPYLLDFTPLFSDEITKSGGKTALYMVWPSKARFFDFPGVSNSYQTAAKRVDGLLYPVGEAWLAAWEVDSSLPLYAADNFHPSLLGTYLAALTMFEQIAGMDLNQLQPVIPAQNGDVAINPKVALILQNAAKQANKNFALFYPEQNKQFE